MRFFEEKESMIARYGEASRRMRRKIEYEDFEGNLDIDDETGIALSEVWDFRNKCRSGLTKLCGNRAPDSKSDFRMFNLAYTYLNRRLYL